MSNLEELIERLCPDGVEYKEIGSIAVLGAGGDVPKARFSAEKTVEFNIPIYSNGIEEKAIYGYTDIPKVDEPSITISARGTIGWCALRKEPFYPIVRLIYVTPNTEILVDFLKYVIDTIKFKVPKTGIPQLTIPMVSKYKIPVPPLEVQREIVRILDNFTFLTTELAAELAARQKQYEYYRNSLLTFEDIQKSMIKSIPWVKLDNIIEFKNGKGHEKCINENGQYIVVNSKFISTNGRVKKFSDQQLSPLYNNDILMVMSDLPNGQALAKTYLVKENSLYTLNQRICALTVKNKNYSTKFLFYYLNRNKQLLKYDNGVDQTNLKKGDILTVIVPVISLAEQQRIVDILDRFDTLCNDITSGLPAEIEARQKQYEYYRDKLLTFKELKKEA